MLPNWWFRDLKLLVIKLTLWRHQQMVMEETVFPFQKRISSVEFHRKIPHMLWNNQIIHISTTHARSLLNPFVIATELSIEYRFDLLFKIVNKLANIDYDYNKFNNISETWWLYAWFEKNVKPIINTDLSLPNILMHLLLRIG